MTDSLLLVDRMMRVDAVIKTLESPLLVMSTDHDLMASLKRERARLEDEWQAYLKSHANPPEDTLRAARAQGYSTKAGSPQLSQP